MIECPKCKHHTLEDQGALQQCLNRECQYTHREICVYTPCCNKSYYPRKLCLYHQELYNFVQWFTANRQLDLTIQI